MMSEIIKNRHEIVFVYDVKDGNPNGDPMDSNKPRMDEKTGQNIVSDVRLKRTVRDYMEENDHEVFVNGEAKTIEKRAGDLVDNIGKKTKEVVQKELLEKCIDLRLFGGTLSLKGGKMATSFTGPVQFRMGRSLHVVDPVFIQGTSAFTTGEEKSQRSFREEWLLHYSCIAFYGVVNQNSAKYTLLTDEDVEILFKSIWNGTKDLITRSKMEQLPRLLIDVVYNDNQNFHIGELDKALKLKTEVQDEEIRGVSQYTLDVSELKGLLDKYSGKIKEVNYQHDERLKITANGELLELKDLLKGKTSRTEW